MYMYLSNQELISYHLFVSVRKRSVLLSLLNSPAYLLITTLTTSPLRFPILLCILLFYVSILACLCPSRVYPFNNRLCLGVRKSDSQYQKKLGVRKSDSESVKLGVRMSDSQSIRKTRSPKVGLPISEKLGVRKSDSQSENLGVRMSYDS